MSTILPAGTYAHPETGVPMTLGEWRYGARYWTHDPERPFDLAVREYGSVWAPSATPPPLVRVVGLRDDADRALRAWLELDAIPAAVPTPPSGLWVGAQVRATANTDAIGVVVDSHPERGWLVWWCWPGVARWTAHGDDARPAVLASTVPTQQPIPGRGRVNVVFDGPPGPKAGRFVEVEDAFGRCVCRTWRQEGSFWVLVIP